MVRGFIFVVSLRQRIAERAKSQTAEVELEIDMIQSILEVKHVDVDFLQFGECAVGCGEAALASKWPHSDQAKPRK
jgi:hypothetical protein